MNVKQINIMINNPAFIGEKLTQNG